MYTNLSYTHPNISLYSTTSYHHFPANPNIINQTIKPAGYRSNFYENEGCRQCPFYDSSTFIDNNCHAYECNNKLLDAESNPFCFQGYSYFFFLIGSDLMEIFLCFLTFMMVLFYFLIFGIYYKYIFQKSTKPFQQPSKSCR